MNAQEALDRLSTLYDRNLRPAEAVAEAMSIYLEMGARIDEMDVIRATAKQVIGDVLAEVGTDKLETDAGLAYITKPSVRVSYDTKGLDRLASERPDLGSVLALYRNEKEIAGTLTVRAPGGNGKQSLPGR